MIFIDLNNNVAYNEVQAVRQASADIHPGSETQENTRTENQV